MDEIDKKQYIDFSFYKVLRDVLIILSMSRVVSTISILINVYIFY